MGLRGSEEGRRISRPLLAVAALSLVVWIPILPVTQPAQSRRRALEGDLEAGRIKAAVARVRGRERAAFPPHWDPPPRPGYGEQTPDLAVVLATALEGDAPYWFAAMYVEKMATVTSGRDRYEGRSISSDAKRRSYVRIRDALDRYRDAERLLQASDGFLKDVLVRLDAIDSGGR